MTLNLADIYERVVDSVPDRVAVVCGERRLTYASLEERANRLAHHLAAAGVGRGDHVGVHLYNGTEYVEAMLAAFKIRAVPINVNYRYVEGELRYLFDDADLVALVHQREFAPRIARISSSVPRLRHLLFVEDGSSESLDGLSTIEYESALESSSAERRFAVRSEDDVFVFYTGGTTGMPKGVMWRHEDIFFAGMAGANPAGDPLHSPVQVAEAAAAKEPAAMFPVAPLMHGAAQLGTFITLFGGGKVVLLRRFDAADVWRLVDGERVNTVSIVGDAMARPMAEALASLQGQLDFSSLLAISSAGAILSETVKQQLAAMLPAVMLLDSFGASETGYQGMGTEDSSPDKGLRFQMNDRTSVLGPDLRPLQPGSIEVGRVALRGHIPLGYYKDPEKTAQVFVTIDGVRWVMPGDMAMVNADGTVTVLGRGAVCINTGGEKVFPEEVEAALKSHPHIFDAVVVGVPDDRWGQRIAAIVEPRPGKSLHLDDVAAHCAGRLARYKLPRELHLVDRVVRSPSGKPDYGWAQRIALATPAKA